MIPIEFVRIPMTSFKTVSEAAAITDIRATLLTFLRSSITWSCPDILRRLQGQDITITEDTRFWVMLYHPSQNSYQRGHGTYAYDGVVHEVSD